MSRQIREALAVLDFNQPERVTLNDRVYNDLRRMIISGRLRPGQSLSIRALAEVVNVSPMPVRSALQRLVAEGALDVQPNRTFALPVLTPDAFREIANVRAALEGMATESAAINLTEVDVALLHDLNQKMFASEGDGWEVYLDLNRQFHFHIYNAASMPQLLRLIESLWLRIGPLLNLVASREGMRFGQEAHEAAVRAIALGNPKDARAAIERDILEAARAIIDGLGRGDFTAD